MSDQRDTHIVTQVSCGQQGAKPLVAVVDGTGPALRLSRMRQGRTPIAGRYSIQDVSAQCIPDLQLWVVEVVRRIVGHPNPLHDGARSQVRSAGERHDLAEAGLLEPERN